MLTDKEQKMSFDAFEKEMTKEIHKDTQRDMKRRGLDIGKVDGDIGPKTLKQADAYNKMKEVGQDTILDSPTGNTLFGSDAIAYVEQIENRDLSDEERRVIELEGYVPKVYKDDKGIPTYGVGQTGEYISKGFKASFDEHEKKTRDLIENYDDLPPYLRAELVQATYRGDLGGSPTFRRLFNEGKYDEAADEFLDNDDYRNSVAINRRGRPHGVAPRMEAVADAVREYGSEQEPLDVFAAIQSIFGSSIR